MWLLLTASTSGPAGAVVPGTSGRSGAVVAPVRSGGPTFTNESSASYLHV